MPWTKTRTSATTSGTGTSALNIQDGEDFDFLRSSDPIQGLFFINLHLKYLVIFCTCNLMFIFDFIFRQKFFKIEFNRIVLHNVLFWTKIMKSIVRIKIVISHYDDSPNIIFEPKNHQNTKYVPICITPNTCMRFWYSDAISFIKHLESCYSGRLGDISR